MICYTYLNFYIFGVVAILYKLILFLEEMETKYFATGFFVFIFILLAVGFIGYGFLVKKGVSQNSLTVVWGGLIFLFIFVGIVAISLVVRNIQERKNFFKRVRK